MKTLGARVVMFFLLLLAPLQIRGEETSILVCENGLEMLEWNIAFIRQAQEAIEFLPCFFGGGPARRVLTELAARLEEVPTLQIHLLASSLLLGEEEHQLIDYLKTTYPDNFHIELTTQVLQLLPDLSSIDNHVKMCVVDGTYFSMGGTNCEESHCAVGTFTPARRPRYPEVTNVLPAGMRDQDIVGKGKLAGELRKIFFSLYTPWEGYNRRGIFSPQLEPDNTPSRFFPIHTPCKVEKLDHSPTLRKLAASQVTCVVGGPHQKNSAITEAYIHLIEEAQSEIVIEQIYFFPVETLFSALLDAITRGVEVTVVTNGLHETSPRMAKFFCWANRLSYAPLFYGRTFHVWDAEYARSLPLKASQIFEYQVPDVILHKKIMIVDKRKVVVGSYNWGFKSAYDDYELVVVIDSPEVAEDLYQIHLTDRSLACPVSYVEACKWYFDPLTVLKAELQRKYQGFL